MSSDQWDQIEKLFHAALDQPPEMRSSFLAQASCDDSVRQEVASLLAHTRPGDSLLEKQLFQSSPAGDLSGQIGAYRIEGLLGKGGMGAVYRAYDTKLNRSVAVKVLSDELAGPVARRRFQREAQMASALNHPHIVTVHDAGEIEGRQYLVTEFVDGGTLRDWARAGNRTWQDVVELLLGVADGLARAQEAGILHRDVKPDNILVSRSGYAKLADFGLAKLLEPQSEESSKMTVTGAVLGTVAYMSPERAAGQPVDGRSDIFSFGLVLYEMVAGRRAFEASSSLEMVQKIVHGQPDPLPRHVPVGLRAVIAKALEKRPADRYQSGRDLVVDLRGLLREPGKAPILASAKQSRFARLAIGLLILVAAVAGALGLRARVSAPMRPQYSQITNFTDSAHAPALSADGRMVAFIRGGQHFQSRGQIYVKLLPDGEAVRLTNEAELKYGPVFSPDGSRVAYTLISPGRSWDTWTVPVLGGQPTLLLPNASGLVWMEPRQVLYSEIEAGTGIHMGIVTSAEDRSNERVVYFPPHKRAMAHYSYSSPDRKRVLIVEMDHSTAWLPCRLMSFDGSESRQVGPNGACLAAGWSPDGAWMYFNAEVDGSWHLWRQRFPNGTPEQITFGPSEEQGLAVSPDGSGLVTSVGKRSNTIWIHDGSGERAISAEASAFHPSLSADGKRVFYLLRRTPASVSSDVPAASPSSPFGVTGAIWSLDLASGKAEPVLSNVSTPGFVVSRDGKQILYGLHDSNESQIWLAPLDRQTQPRLVTAQGGAMAFGRPGEVVFRATEGDRDYYYRINTDGSGRERISSTPVLTIPRVSYDGNWVAGMTAASGSAAKWETTLFEVHGNRSRKFARFFAILTWSADGRFLYVDPDTARNSTSGGATYVIPLQPGKPVPDIPEGGFAAPADLVKQGVKIVRRSSISPGPDPSVYAFEVKGFEGNLFRVSLPR